MTNMGFTFSILMGNLLNALSSRENNTLAEEVLSNSMHQYQHVMSPKLWQSKIITYNSRQAFAKMDSLTELKIILLNEMEYYTKWKPVCAVHLKFYILNPRG